MGSAVFKYMFALCLAISANISHGAQTFRCEDIFSVYDSRFLESDVTEALMKSEVLIEPSSDLIANPKMIRALKDLDDRLTKGNLSVADLENTLDLAVQIQAQQKPILKRILQTLGPIRSQTILRRIWQREIFVRTLKSKLGSSVISRNLWLSTAQFMSSFRPLTNLFENALRVGFMQIQGASAFWIAPPLPSLRIAEWRKISETTSANLLQNDWSSGEKILKDELGVSAFSQAAIANVRKTYYYVALSGLVFGLITQPQAYKLYVDSVNPWAESPAHYQSRIGLNARVDVQVSSWKEAYVFEKGHPPSPDEEKAYRVHVMKVLNQQ